MQTHPTRVAGAGDRKARRIAMALIGLAPSVRQGTRGAPIRLDWNDDTTLAPASEGAMVACAPYLPDLDLPRSGEKVEGVSSLARSISVQRLFRRARPGETHSKRREDSMGFDDIVDMAVAALTDLGRRPDEPCGLTAPGLRTFSRSGFGQRSSCAICSDRSDRSSYCYV